MIGRRPRREDEEVEIVRPKGFDDFELRLGDTMRGERATMGKSLLDVQRELRIRASYIAAIENSDPSAFDTPGFIAGYVRSYARYLGMDPDETFATFCAESGFEVAHGMSNKASGLKKPGGPAEPATRADDPFISPATPYLPGGEPWSSHIDLRAVGSVAVLLALIGGIGYGGWSVLKQVQQVQVAPVEQAPVVLSDLDPLESAVAPRDGAVAGGPVAPSAEALDRLYRPQALDVPVLVARDAPISTLDPRMVGSFRTPDLPEVQIAEAQQPAELDPVAVPQVVEEVAPNLVMVAVRPAWVRVTAADGTSILEEIMEPGDSYEVPLTEEPPMLRAGESGAIYFLVNGEHYGPVGARGVVTKDLPLSIDEVTGRYQVADIAQDSDLARMVAEAQTAPVDEAPADGD